MAAAAVLPSRPVGALACQRDSYLRTLDAEVISCTRLPPKKDSKKSSSKKSEAEALDLYQIELSDSVLFPEGGGQHSDHGTLTPLSNESGEGIAIGNVQRDGLRSVCHSPSSLEPGTKVRQQVDFARRWDHMQQHTAQHLLSAIMDTYPNLETVGWGMAATPSSSNYVDLPRKPSASELEAIQNRCNELIRENLKIDVVYPEGEGLPADEEVAMEKGVVRIIKIGELDSNACCGTHLAQTSHISLILLQNSTTVHGGKHHRLSFLAGDRAVRLATGSADAIRSISTALTCGNEPGDVVAAMERMRVQAAEGKRKGNRLLKEIASFEGERVRGELRAGRNAWMHRPQEGMEFLNTVLAECKQEIKESKDAIAVLAVGEEGKAGQIVIVGRTDAVASFAAKLQQSGIEVKGNGKGERWQGKVVQWKKGDLKTLERLVNGKGEGS